MAKLSEENNDKYENGSMYEKRLTQRLTNYWNSLKKDKAMPPFQKFNPGAIDDVWDHCILLSITESASGKNSYSYYSMGDKVKKLYDHDVTGERIFSTQKGSRGANIVKRIGEVLQKPDPIFDSGQFLDPNHKVVKFRSCLLPFGQNGHVTHVVVGLSWREFG